ncbi:hypothetical protein LQ948_18560 [Jiella sp. MQZ9-1]|uniref:Uncharacterized protein n=1 Tax=Jiella flava TaxID=2816857 RepID=A0A939JXG2_9HYPH|nr:hypothetical protein [Jiella flava]MBO0664564.1 hypothetical protein [Jiella flava]MCD2473197.1 hypothetical protein [Jiella flava]
MDLILRLGGRQNDIQQVVKLTQLRPYRVDDEKPNQLRMGCLHFDIGGTKPLSDSESIAALKRFVQENEAFLSGVQKFADLITRDIDVGIIMPSDIVAKSLSLDAELLALLSQFGLSITISVYKGSEEESA